jgi:hypothetical protein
VEVDCFVVGAIVVWEGDGDWLLVAVAVVFFGTDLVVLVVTGAVDLVALVGDVLTDPVFVLSCFILISEPEPEFSSGILIFSTFSKKSRLSPDWENTCELQKLKITTR